MIYSFLFSGRSEDQIASRLRFPRTALLCLDIYNRFILCSLGFWLVWDYPILDAWYAAYLICTILALLCLHCTQKLSLNCETRWNPPLWPRHMVTNARLQRCAGAARLADHTVCIHPSRILFRLSGQNSVSCTHYLFCGKRLLVPIFTRTLLYCPPLAPS